MISGAALRAAREVLGRLREKDPKGYYEVPVDTTYLSDYLDLVAKPMDLSKIERSLESYVEVATFVADLKLVYANSMTYCRGKKEYRELFKLASKLAKQVEREVATTLAPFLAAKRPALAESTKAAMLKIVASLKRSRHSMLFREPVDSVAFPDYPTRVPEVLDLSKLESRTRGGFYDDVATWVRDLRRIAANCLRFNVDVRHREVRDQGKKFSFAVEKELEAQRHVFFRDDVPSLLEGWDAVVSVVEDSILNEFDDGGRQRAYAFLHPVASYYDSKEAVDYYARAVEEPISVGEVVGDVVEGTSQSLADVDAGVRKVFSNCLSYFGPDGAGRAAHGDADADAYCDLSRHFSAKWSKAIAPLLRKYGLASQGSQPRDSTRDAATTGSTTTAKRRTPSPPPPPPPASEDSGKNKRRRRGKGEPVIESDTEQHDDGKKKKKKPSSSSSSSAGKAAVEASCRRVLAALRAHRMTSGYETATPFAAKAMLPRSPEYAVAVAEAMDLATVEKRLKSYASLDAFAADVERCFANAEAWKQHLAGLQAAGLLNSKGLTDNDLALATETVSLAKMLEATLELELINAAEEVSVVEKPPAAPSQPGPPPPKSQPPKSKKPRKALPPEQPTDVAPRPRGKQLVLNTTTSEETKALLEKTLEDAAPPKELSAERPPPPKQQQRATTPGGSSKKGKKKKDTGKKTATADGEESESESVVDDGRRSGLTAAVVSPEQPWRAAAEKVVVSRLNKHDWVARNSEFGRLIRWHEAAADVFPAIKDAYLAKIPRPADLGLVTRKLRSGAYDTPAAFAEEVTLVFDNAVRYNAAAKQAGGNAGAGADDLACKIYDIAAHLRDWTEHLCLEYLVDHQKPLKRDAYECALDAAALADARVRDALASQQSRHADQAADLSTDALSNFVAAAAAAESSSSHINVVEEDDVVTDAKEKKDGASSSTATPVLTAARRLELRRYRDEIAWPSRLRFNQRANQQAKKALQVLRRQNLKKYSQAFEEPVSLTLVPDYLTYVEAPTCLQQVEKRLAASLAAESSRRRDDSEENKPYETMGDFAEELRRVFENARRYNARFREAPASRGFQIIAAVDVLAPHLEDALFELAFVAYERVKYDRVLAEWNRQVEEKQKARTRKLETERLEMRRIAEQRLQEAHRKNKTATRKDRVRILRGLSVAGVLSLDVLTPDDKPPTPTPMEEEVVKEEAPVSSSAKDVADAGAAEEKMDETADHGSSASARDGSFRPFAVAERPGRVLLLRTQRRRPAAFALDDDDDREAAAQREREASRKKMPRLTDSEPAPPRGEPPDDAAMSELPVLEVDAVSGDSDWFSPREGLSLRVFVSCYDGLVRCDLVARADSDAVAPDLSPFAYEAAPTTEFPSLADALAYARATQRRRLALRALDDSDRVAFAVPPDPLQADLAALPLRPVGRGDLLATPPLPSCREGRPHLEAVLFAKRGALALAVHDHLRLSHPALRDSSGL